MSFFNFIKDNIKGADAQTFFCSYRSPKYEDMLNCHCTALSNNKFKCCAGNNVFRSCSNKKCLYKELVSAASSIIQENSEKVKYYRHIPPKYILPNNVLLTPREMMELTPKMFNEMTHSKYFVLFKLDERGDSFWTVLEQEIWKNYQLYHKKKPIVYLAAEGSLKDKIELEGDISEPLNYICSKIRKKDELWVGPVPPSLPNWSKLSDNIYIQSCPLCGNSFILSSGFIHACIKRHLEVKCPHCNRSHFTYSYYGQNIIYNHIGKNEYNNKILSPNFVASLLFKEEVPASIPYFNAI